MSVEKQKDKGIERLAKKGVSRRDFLRLCTASCLAFGLPLSFAPKLAEAAAKDLMKKPLLWMQGQGCTGCSESLLSSLNPGPEQLLLDVLSVRYHPTLMAAAGEQAIQSLEECMGAGNYLLVLEGSIPTADPRFCLVEGKPFHEQFLKVAAKAEAVLAVGSCASFGGIPRAGMTGAKGAQEVLREAQINVPVINLPSCPVKPDRLVGTLLYYLGQKEIPRLDKLSRPIAYYRYTLHDSCYRRLHYEYGEFLQDWNNPSTEDWCLYQKGCKGQETYTNCAGSGWNDGANYCGMAGSPCAGCSEPKYYDQFAPLFTNPKEEK